MSRPTTRYFTEKVYEIASHPEFHRLQFRLRRFQGVGRAGIITSIYDREFMSMDLYVTFPVIIPSNPEIEYYIIPVKFSKKKGDMLHFHNLMKTLDNYRHTIDHPEHEPDELILSKIDMEWLISHQMVQYSYPRSNSQYIIETFYTNKSNNAPPPLALGRAEGYRIPQQNRSVSTRNNSRSHHHHRSASTRKNSHRSSPLKSHVSHSPQSRSSNQPNAAPLRPTRSKRNYYYYPL